MEASQKRPKIKALRSFAQAYFPKGSCPAIQWEKMNCWGRSYMERNTITLNPNIPADLEEHEIEVGILTKGISYKSPEIKGLRLSEGEQYFLTLLHEIGHFKGNDVWSPPEEWLRVKKKIEEEWSEWVKMNEYWGDPKPSREEEFDLKRDWVWKHLEQKDDEDDADFEGRLEDVQSWLLGMGTSQHMTVEDWALKEFKNRRGEIQRLIICP